MSEQRKASEVLLDLELKIDKLISLCDTQNLNNKILSNKLNEIMVMLNKPQTSSSKSTIEAVVLPPVSSSLQNFQPLDPEKQVAIFAEDKLPETNSPQGFRRTSRPETFSGDDAYLNQSKEQKNGKFPSQTPKTILSADKLAIPEITANIPLKQPVQQSSSSKITKSPLVQNAVPVSQRIVDKNGKSVFLADVELTNLNGEVVYKTRTNGTGKWMASLSIGQYRVTIRKRESVDKDKLPLEAVQDIQIDGKSSPLELPVLIIK